MFFSLLGGTPKPEPEQVIRNYTEELKTAPDEVGVTGATLLWFCLETRGSSRRRMQPVLCWKDTSQGGSGCQVPSSWHLG